MTAAPSELNSSAQGEEGRRVPVRLLGGCAFLLLLLITYNLLGGWHARPRQTGGARPAALPLQRRMRMSKYLDDPEAPDTVVAHFSTLQRGTNPAR